MSRHVWIDKDASADVAKLHAHGITRCYFDACSTPVPSAMFPFQRGIYRAQNWTPNITPGYLAHELSDDVARWGGDPYKQLAVHANIELHDPAYLVAFLKAWRAIRPYRETALVIEGLQGGWFSDELRAYINGQGVVPAASPSGGVLGMDVLAEAYTGSMGPLDPDNVRANLVNYGVARQRAMVMYDAARLSPFWDGCAFTQQRLP